MRIENTANTVVIVAFLAAMAQTGVYSAPKDTKPATSDVATTNNSEKVDFDFTRMNQTMRATYIYRLAGNPGDFAGKTLRISGQFVTGIDENDGIRRYGCLLMDQGGCCSQGVLEFIPRDTYAWPTNCPPIQARITLCGRIKIVEVREGKRSLSIPQIQDAEIIVGL